jgi:hypothetical protein
MNQEAKEQIFVEQVSIDFEMKQRTKNNGEILLFNHASYPLFVGSKHFSINPKDLGEKIFGFDDFLSYLRFVMILRIILRRKVTKKSGANLG